MSTREQIMNYFIPALAAFILSWALTWVVRLLAQKFNIVDKPDQARKIHSRPTPLLGGLAIFLAFTVVAVFVWPRLVSGDLNLIHWLGVWGGALILMIGGFWDDKYNLRPARQIIFPLLAIGAVIMGGVEITKITNPAGGFIYLAPWLSALLIGVWLLGMMYTTKLLDGVDGLVSGVGAIGSLVIFLFTITTQYYQPDIALAAIILAGATLGFWVWNFNPAKIFLGEGGSLFLGYILGVLAIISGGKIAVALLIMGVPILDVAWTILRRLLKGKNPFKFADRKHLHHRLLALGLNQKQTVLVFYILAATFGLSGLFLQSRGKLLALLILFLVMAVLVIGFSWWDKKKRLPRLLIHTCCAPCVAYGASQILAKDYEITLYFCNSNLDSRDEYERRLEAVRFVAEKYSFGLLVEPYDHSAWEELVVGYESEPERGRRCDLCFRSRLSQTALVAQQKKFDYFTTSLTLSPFKDSAKILALGQSLGANFLPYDFKLNDGVDKSLALAKELGIYRQKYCGCEFSNWQKK